VCWLDGFQLWDVTSDQAAVDLIRNVSDPQQASQVLLDHALNSFSTDNLSVLVVRYVSLPPSLSSSQPILI
jgi:serine/threonine protein phosphatase PrpC